MRRLLGWIGLALLAGSVGCSESDSGDSAEPAAQPVPPGYARNVTAYEKSVGKSHGLSPEKVNELMEEIRAAPEMKNTFLGVKALQKPSDAWIVMEIIAEVKPDLIVEAGTYHGGSAVLWAVVLEHVNPDGRVVTIDIEDLREPGAVSLPIAQRKVDFLLGSSTDPEIVAEVHRRAEGKRVLVLLDSLHSKEHVAAELEAYAPLVPVGSYVIVQDTYVGPMPAIDEFLAKNDAFVADRTKERYEETNSPRGYLLRRH